MTLRFNEQLDVSHLVGKHLTGVEKRNDDEIVFTTADGEEYRLMHFSDCCESVTIEDVCGDLSDLVGHPILTAEEVVHQQKNPEGVKVPEYQDSFTWTFYKFATNKGSVTIRWYGESNGYYSESVSFVRAQ